MRRWRVAAVDVPDRVVDLPFGVLIRIGPQLLMVLIHRPGDHVEIHPLGRFRLLIHEIGQAFGRGIGQPFVDGQPVAPGLGNLLPVFVQEQFIGEMLGLPPAQNFADAVIDRGVGGMILAVHLEIHVQRRPARAEIGLPLQLHMAAGDGKRPFPPVLVIEGHGAGHRIHDLDRDIEHAPGFGMDRQEAGIGLLTLFPKRGQHNVHDRVIAFGGPQQRGVELARAVEFGGRDEFVFESERIQKPAQHGVVMRAEAFIFAEGVRHRGQRLLAVQRQHLLLRHIVRNLAHTIQIIGKADHPGGNIADHLERAADHRGAGHLAKGADMGQSAGAVAGFEQDIALFGVLSGVTRLKAAGLFKGPGFRLHRGIAQGRHRRHPCGTGRPRARDASRVLLPGRFPVNILHPQEGLQG